MEYYILNIKREDENGHRFNAVDKWISDVGIAPIFFGKSSIESIMRDHNPRIAYLFCSESFKESWKQSVIVSLGETDLYLYSPLESVKEYNEEFPDSKDNIKGCRIFIKKKFAIKDVPLVLSTIKSNAYLGRGTFQKIPRKGGSFGGNICAIKYLLDGHVSVDNLEQYLFCLSSLEFETLVAKLLEEKGFFVPAYHEDF